MFASIARKIFGSRNDRLLKKLGKAVTAINALEPEYEQLSDEQLKAKTAEFKQNFQHRRPPPDHTQHKVLPHTMFSQSPMAHVAIP